MNEQPELRERIARAMCAEKNAVYGEPPCWEVEGPWPNPNCGDCTCHDLADAVLSALSPQPPVTPDWQPIETAPKDGLIDIWLADGVRWCDCYHDRITDTWRTSRPSGRLLSIQSKFVTHWMKRPEPPEGGQDHD